LEDVHASDCKPADKQYQQAFDDLLNLLQQQSGNLRQVGKNDPQSNRQQNSTRRPCEIALKAQAATPRRRLLFVQ